MTKKLAFQALVMGAFLVSSAVAQGQNACEAEQAKFCPDVQGLQVLKCLVDHWDELSPACQKQMEPARAHLQKGKTQKPAAGAKKGNLRAACGAEIDKHCKEFVGKPAKMRACLSEHEAELSEGCKATLKSIMEQTKEPPAAQKPQ